MTGTRQWDGASRALLRALVAGTALCGAAIAGAWRLDARVVVEPPPAPRPAGTDLGVPPIPSAGMLASAIARDPFRPDRRPPPQRYRAGAPGPAATSAPPSVLHGIRLLGTVAGPAGDGLAALALPGAPPRVLRVGQSLGEVRLVHVEREAATLATADTTVVIRLTRPEPRGRRR